MKAHKDSGLPQYHQILDHFFAEVMVNAVNLFLCEKCREMF